MKRERIAAVIAGLLCMAAVAHADSSKIGFGAGQNLDAKEFLAEAKAGIPVPTPAMMQVVASRDTVPTYQCTAGAGIDVVYIFRSSVARSRAEECAERKCLLAGHRVCTVVSTVVDRLVLTSEIYYRASSIVQGF